MKILCHSCEATRLFIISVLPLKDSCGSTHFHFFSLPFNFSKIPSQFFPITFLLPKKTPKYLKPSLFHFITPGSFKSPLLHLPTAKASLFSQFTFAAHKIPKSLTISPSFVKSSCVLTTTMTSSVYGDKMWFLLKPFKNRPSRFFLILHSMGLMAIE